MALTKTELLARFTSVIALATLATDPIAPVDGQIWHTEGEIKAQIAEQTVTLNRLETISIKDCGGRADDPLFDNNAAIMLGLARAQLTGAKLLFTKGTWWTSPLTFIQTAPLHVKGSPRAEIKGIAGGGTSAVVRIDGGTDRPPLVWMGLAVNNSLRSYASAAASGTALNIVNLDDWMITGCTFDAGASWWDKKGDSGVAVNQCGFGILAYNKFKGQPDKGGYFTGGPSNAAADDYGEWIVAWNNFYRCNTACSFTRQSRLARFFGNTVTECDLGVGRTEAGEGLAAVSPGREIIVTGNNFNRIGSRAVRLNMEGGDIVEGNIFTDWGYDPVKLTLTTGTQSLIRMDGACNSKILGNTFRFRDWVCTPTHKAVELRRMEWPGPAEVKASFTGTTMTVNSVTSGALFIGMKLTGTGIPANTYIIDGSGTTWLLNNAVVGSNVTVTANGASYYPTGNIITGNTFEMQAGAGIFEASGTVGTHGDNLYVGNVTPVLSNNAASNSVHVVRRPDGSVKQLRNNVSYSGSWTPTVTVTGGIGATITYSTDPLDRTGTYDRIGDLVLLSFKVVASITLPASAVVNASFSGNTMSINSTTSGALAIGQQVIGGAIPAGTTITGSTMTGGVTNWTLSASVTGSNVTVTAFPVGQVRVGGMPFASAGDAPAGNGSPGICTGVTIPVGSNWNTEVAAGVTYVRCWLGTANRVFDTRDLNSITGAVPMRLAGSVQYRCLSEVLWTPVHYDDAVLAWFDAADASTLTIEGGKVSAWKSKGTIAVTPSQATSAKRPAYSVVGWDDTSRPCLTGDGLVDGQMLSAAIDGLKGNYWLFIVAERGTQTDDSGSGYRPLVSTADANGIQALSAVMRPTSDAGQASFRTAVVDGTVAAVSGFAAGTKAVLFSDFGPVVQSGINGATPTGAGTHGTTARNPMTFSIFGDPATNARRFGGKIAEILLVNPALLPDGGSVAERQRIDAYLVWKWAVQFVLPTNHIHYAAAPRA
jgi:hypothetical protein